MGLGKETLLILFLIVAIVTKPTSPFGLGFILLWPLEDPTTFPPGFVECDGSLLDATSYTELFSLLNTTFGGNATAFALPDLKGRFVLHHGTGPGLTHRSLGERGGTQYVSLTEAQIASHTHLVSTSSAFADNNSPAGNILAATSGGDLIYRDPEAPTQTSLRYGTITSSGGGQGHYNIQPFTSLTFLIAINGTINPSSSRETGTPFSGVDIITFDWVPSNHMQMDGQILSINSFGELFSSLGTTFGGDGTTTFGLADIRGRSIRGSSVSFPIGTKWGEESVTIAQSQLPQHVHTLRAASSIGNPGAGPSNNHSIARSGGGNAYQTSTTTNIVSLSASCMATTGGGQAHNNMSPFTTLNFVLSTVVDTSAGQVIAPRGRILAVTSSSFSAKGYLPADGRSLLAAQYIHLYLFLQCVWGCSTNFEGKQTFKVPNLSNIEPMGSDTENSVGTYGGVTSVTLSVNEMPSHTHDFNGNTATATSSAPQGKVLASPQGLHLFDPSAQNVDMAYTSIIGTGGGEPHNNQSPYLSLPYFLCAQRRGCDPSDTFDCLDIGECMYGSCTAQDICNCTGGFSGALCDICSGQSVGEIIISLGVNPDSFSCDTGDVLETNSSLNIIDDLVIGSIEMIVNGNLTIRENITLSITLDNVGDGSIHVEGCALLDGNLHLSVNSEAFGGNSNATFDVIEYTQLCQEMGEFVTIGVDNVDQSACEQVTLEEEHYESTMYSVVLSLDTSECKKKNSKGEDNALAYLAFLVFVPIAIYCVCCIVILIAGGVIFITWLSSTLFLWRMRCKVDSNLLVSDNNM